MPPLAASSMKLRSPRASASAEAADARPLNTTAVNRAVKDIKRYFMMELLRQSGIEKDSTLLHLDCVGVISFMTCAYIGHSLEYAHAPRIVCASARLSSHP